MYIHEAVEKALEAPSVMYRVSEGDAAFLLVAKNPRECLYGAAQGCAKLCYGWEPRAEDLIADDWVVRRANGIEWPEPAPSEIQRKWKRFLRYGVD